MATRAQPDERADRVRSGLRTLVPAYAPIPPPILEALRVLADSSSSFEQLAPLLDDVEGLRESLLRIVNSPVYSPGSPIRDVGQAAVMIGLRSVNLIILAHALQPYFERLTLSYGYTNRGLWTHLVAVASTAWSIAEHFRFEPECCALAFVAGLFHDVGKILVADYLTRSALALDLTRSPREAPGLVLLEDEALGISHAAAGRLLVEHWSLDPAVCELVERHHDLEEGCTRELAVLHLADYFVSTFVVGYRDDLPPETFLDPRALDWFESAPDFLTSCEAISLRESARAIDIVQALR